MSDRNYQRLMLSIAVAVLLLRCATAPRKSEPLRVRGDVPHLNAKAEAYSVAVGEMVNIKADVVGDFGKGNVICLTPEWLVTAVGVPFVMAEHCGQEMTFYNPYRFLHQGEYEIVVTMRYRSGAVFDRKAVKIFVGGRDEVAR